MTNTTNGSIRRYLLGQLAPDDQSAIEERLFLDDDFARLVELAEEELIDECARELLPEADRDAFFRNFLSTPNRRHRLNIANQLVSALTTSLPAPARPGIFVRWAFAAGAAALITSGAVIYYLSPPADTAQRRVPAHEAGSAGEKRASPTAPAEEAFIAYLRRDSVSRGGQPVAQQNFVPAGRKLELRLEMQVVDGSAGPAYSALVRSPQHETVLRLSDLRLQRSGARVFLAVPVAAGMLRPGRHTAVVRAEGDEVDEYTFDVRSP